VHDEILEPQRVVSFFVEGQESKPFRKLMIGDTSGHDSADEDEEFQEAPFIDYESIFVRKTHLLPQEPRLFCLMLGGVVVEYDQDQSEPASQEKEQFILKEIHSFGQRSLDQKGLFLLDFSSECFVWVGKKVQHRVLALQVAYQTLALLHPEHTEKMAVSIVESGFEPEIFKQAFREGWQNFQHSGQNIGVEEDSDDEEGGKKERKQTLVLKTNIDIIPEGFWIN